MSYSVDQTEPTHIKSTLNQRKLTSGSGSGSELLVTGVHPSSSPSDELLGCPVRSVGGARKPPAGKTQGGEKPFCSMTGYRSLQQRVSSHTHRQDKTFSCQVSRVLLRSSPGKRSYHHTAGQRSPVGVHQYE